VEFDCAATESNVVKTYKEIASNGFCTTFLPRQHSLANQTLKGLREFFERHTNHRPSPAMWAALEDLAKTLEQMAEGRCEPGFYLSSLDPGVGKTQTITRFTKALMASPGHSDVGVLICVSRLSEIQSLVKDMGLDDEDYAAFTSDRSLNLLGCGKPESGRVLFTTQQMVERRCRDEFFEDVESFYYQGLPRQVRIWDESMLPGQTVTLDRDRIGFLFQPLRSLDYALAETIEKVFSGLKYVEDGALFSVPDFAEDHGVDLNEVMRVLEEAPLIEQEAASSLWMLSGKTVAVRKDGFLGTTILDFKETLPQDLAPVVILDASGRVRSTYTEWEKNRGGLIRLKSAPKSYKGLRVHCWRRSGSKTAFRKEGMELVEGIVSTINSKPDEEWLVVCHKPTRNYDVESSVRDLIGIDKDNVHFITWGNHQATNEFSHVKNVILAGTLFYRSSHLEALGRLAAGRHADQGRYTCKERRKVELGEHAHLVLQALCRGAVRVCEEGMCSPCDAYIIASTKSGIERSLPRIFPGCNVVRWKPVKSVLTGKVKEAVEFIDGWFEDNPQEDFLPFRTVMKTMGMKSASNFRKAVRQHSGFMEAMDDRFIREHGKGKYRTGFLRLSAEYFGFS